jgi:putative membrane protein
MTDARELLVVYLKGFAMGAADAVPGVSGGTIALITGIYDRLVGAIAALEVAGGLALLRDLARPHDPAARESALERASEMDLFFLLVLGVGVVTAALTAANVIEWAVDAHTGPTYSFFFGLIVASVIVLRGEMALDSPAGWAVAIAGFLLAFFVSGLSSGSTGSGPIVLFLAGVVGISAMVLPGISGSLILLTIGQYETIVGAVKSLTDAAFAADLGLAVPPLVTLLIFASGALVGILSFARVVAWALEHWRVQTMTFLVALMIGALRAPGDRVAAATPEWTLVVAGGLLTWGILGAAAVLGLDEMTDEITY